jgi:hypothetical protein
MHINKQASACSVLTTVALLSLQTRLMQPPNATWQQIIAQATQSPDILKQPEVLLIFWA